MKLIPLKTNVMFRFLDSTGGAKGRFTDSTKSGIIIPTLDSAQKLPRWGVVVAAGPESEVTEGDYILIEALMWSNGSVSKFDDESVWKTEDKYIMLMTNDLEETKQTFL